MHSPTTLIWPRIWPASTDYNTVNWEPGFMTIFVTWQLIVTLDSIRNSCDVLPMMTHLGWPSESLTWDMRGAPPSPLHGSWYSPLLRSTSVPNIFLCLYVVLDTVRSTLFRSSLCWPVQSCPSVTLADLIWHDVTCLDFTYFSSIEWDFIGQRYWIILITFMFFWLQYGNFQWLPCFNFTWPDFGGRGPKFLV